MLWLWREGTARFGGSSDFAVVSFDALNMIKKLFECDFIPGRHVRVLSESDCIVSEDTMMGRGLRSTERLQLVHVKSIKDCR